MTPSALRGRALLAVLYDAAIVGAAPGPLTTAALREQPPGHRQRVHVFALGKAAHAMAAAAVDSLRGSASVLAGGVVVAAEPGPPPHRALVALAGDHPLPGPRSFSAAERLGRQVAAVGRDEVALVLLSGGATSLLAAPVTALSERDLVLLFDLLHRSGLGIHAMNVVRKRLTRWGAGRLAVALAPARTHVLMISDVPGDDPADIASGPCTPDASTAQDVIALLQASSLLPELPRAVREYLDAVHRGTLPETPKADHPAFRGVTTRLIGSNRLAVSAAVRRAGELAHAAQAADSPLVGEAARCGADVADALIARAERGLFGCVVWGGETTVRRAGREPLPSGAEPNGAGGRCQEFALAAARRLASGGAAARRVFLLAAGTDGRDGPTDAAGAYADGSVWEAIVRSGHDPARALERHESYVALDSAGALFRCGPTGTNVMDIVLGVVE